MKKKIQEEPKKEEPKKDAPKINEDDEDIPEEEKLEE